MVGLQTAMSQEVSGTHTLPTSVCSVQQ